MQIDNPNVRRGFERFAGENAERLSVIQRYAAVMKHPVALGSVRMASRERVGGLWSEANLSQQRSLLSAYWFVRRSPLCGPAWSAALPICNQHKLGKP